MIHKLEDDRWHDDGGRIHEPAPEPRMTMDPEFELRFLTTELRVLPAEGDKPPKSAGYAIVYNSPSEDLGGFREIIAPGAARDSVKNDYDVRALVSHNPDYLTGRTTSGTLRLIEDEKGLRFENDLPNTSYARDLMELCKRGDIRGMSFGFKVPKGGDRWSKDSTGGAIRTVNTLALSEISYVATPAYGATSLSMRDLRVDPAVIEAAKTFVEFPEYVKRLSQYRQMVSL